MTFLKACILISLLTQPLHADDNLFFGACVGAIGVLGAALGVNAYSKYSENSDLKSTHAQALKLEQKYAREIELLHQANPADALIYLQEVLRINNMSSSQFIRMLEQDIKNAQKIMATIASRIAQWKEQPNKLEYALEAQKSQKALISIYHYLDKIEKMSKHEKPYLLADEQLKILEPRYAALKATTNSYFNLNNLIRNIQALGAPANFPLIEGIRILKRDIELLDQQIVDLGRHATNCNSHVIIKNRAAQLSSSLHDAFNAVIQTDIYKDACRLEQQARINEQNAKIALSIQRERENMSKKEYEAAYAERIRYENIQKELKIAEQKLQNDRLGIPEYKATIAELRQANHKLKDIVEEKNGVISRLRNEIIFFKRRINEAIKSVKNSIKNPPYNPETTEYREHLMELVQRAEDLIK